MLPRLIGLLVVVILVLGGLMWAARPPVAPPMGAASPAASLGTSPAPSKRGAIDWAALKTAMRARIEKMRAAGNGLPIFDVEAHFDTTLFPPDRLFRDMDKYDLGVMAMSPRWLPKDVASGGLEGWQALNERLVAEGGGRFLPVTTASLHEFVSDEPLERKFLDSLLSVADAQGYPMLGEFYFRRYPRNKDYRAAKSPNSKHDPQRRDFEIPIEGPFGQTLFEFAERHGSVILIHYEVEDRLLAPLERTLERYPHARVVWCHVGRVRYPDRTHQYGPAYLEGLIRRFPNLYFDTSETKVGATYQGSGEVYGVMWDKTTATLRPDWKKLIEDHPDRFMVALDMGVDRMDAVDKHAKLQQHLIGQLRPDVQEKVAFRSAWALLFGEPY